MKKQFELLAQHVYAQITNASEDLILNFDAEKSQFIRFNHGHVRQTGTVEQAFITGKIVKEGKTYFFRCPFSSQEETAEFIKTEIENFRIAHHKLPMDPYATKSIHSHSICDMYPATLPNAEDIPAIVNRVVPELDFVGIYGGGTSFRGVSFPSGTRHWFETTTFSLDYSIYLANGRAIRSTYSEKNWNTTNFEKQIATEKQQISALEQPIKKLERGNYRCYICPSAASELVAMQTGNCFSEQALQQKESPFCKLLENQKPLSPLFSLSEDFSTGLVPRFNSIGEVSPQKIELVANGKFKASLIGSRSAKEYQKQTNGAEVSENVRSPVMPPGNLDAEKALETLGTGIYISALHYLNYSDVPNARITGMTRYSCLWVENGKFVAPINDLRFDDSLYSLF